ncbi:3-hydroxyacyl-CoA dehydrogenase family protein [Erwinia aphidicola]
MRLLEVIAPESVPQRIVASAFSLARRLGKIAVRSGICDGFIGNRIMSVTRRAAEAMLVEGASPYEIDSALRGFGFAMGPFETSDLAGGDIGWATRRRPAMRASAMSALPTACANRDGWGKKPGVDGIATLRARKTGYRTLKCWPWLMPSAAGQILCRAASARLRLFDATCWQ